jgi:hypothetical protein
VRMGPAELFERGVGGMLGSASGEPAQDLLGLRAKVVHLWTRNEGMLSVRNGAKPTWREVGQWQRRMISFERRCNAPPHSRPLTCACPGQERNRGAGQRLGVGQPRQEGGGT